MSMKYFWSIKSGKLHIYVILIVIWSIKPLFFKSIFLKSLLISLDIFIWKIKKFVFFFQIENFGTYAASRRAIWFFFPMWHNTVIFKYYYIKEFWIVPYYIYNKVM